MPKKRQKQSSITKYASPKTSKRNDHRGPTLLDFFKRLKKEDSLFLGDEDEDAPADDAKVVVLSSDRDQDEVEQDEHDTPDRQPDTPFQIVDDADHDDPDDYNSGYQDDYNDSGDTTDLTCPICNAKFKDIQVDMSVHVNACIDGAASDHDDEIMACIDSASDQIKREGMSVHDACIDGAGLQIKREDARTEPVDALSKLISSSRDRRQWSPRRLQPAESKDTPRPCPFYKLLSLTPTTTVAVDAFRFGAIPAIKHYFLSHFHSDHYGGLTHTWTHGQIYCSAATGRLVIGILKVRPEFVVMLDMDVRIELDGFAVTLVDANHCPGSAMFVFEGARTRMLHTGDFRATPAHLRHAAIRNKHMDSLYLDTTYLDPKYTFPSQRDVVDACADAAFHVVNDANTDRFLPASGTNNWLIVVGTYSIGKERVALAIAKKLGAKIYVSARKRNIYACLQDPELDKHTTHDPALGCIHLVSLHEIRPQVSATRTVYMQRADKQTLREYLKEFPQYNKILGFRPTGWSYSPPSDRRTASPATTLTDTILTDWHYAYTRATMKPARGSSSEVVYFDVPYSEHSSFRELAGFVTAVDAGRVIPTVNVGSEKSRQKMKVWYEKWQGERRRKVGEFQQDW